MPLSSGSLAAAMVSLAAALWLWPGAGLIAAARLQALSIPDDGEPAPPVGRSDPRSRALLFAGLAGSSVLVTFPSLGGALAAVATAVGLQLFLSRPASRNGSGSRLPGALSKARYFGRLGGTTPDPTLPFAIDLLAVCLRGGMSTAAALRSVAGAIAGSAGTRGAEPAVPHAGAAPEVSIVLGQAAASCELGSDPATVWRAYVGHSVYGPLARTMIVTGESGSAVAARLQTVSKQLRVAAGHQAMARAQRVGVALMAPLGLCFLPAFVCLGVIPVVVGLAGRVFG